MKKTMLTTGPAASTLGSRVLTPMPNAVNPSIPTTSASRNGTTWAGPWTPKGAADGEHQHDLDHAHDHRVDEDGGHQDPRRHRGSRRSRLSGPISRRFTIMMARTEKQDDMIP